MQKPGRFAERFLQYVNRILARGGLRAKILRAVLALNVFIGTGRLDPVTIALGACTVAAGLIGIEGITNGNEIDFIVSGVSLIAATVIIDHVTRKGLRAAWQKIEGRRHQHRSTTFDITEPAMLSIHDALDQKYPGIKRYGKYWARNRDNLTTHRVGKGEEGNWINQRGQRLMTVTYEWTHGDAQVVVEYRRTPAQLWAARIIDTVGISSQAHREIAETVNNEEWRIRPKHRWICGSGMWTPIVLGLLIFSMIIWGGVDVFFGTDAPFPMNDNTLRYIRTSAAEGIGANLIALLLIVFRCGFFPSGVLRIGAEKLKQQRREEWQTRIVQLMMTVVIAASTTFLTILLLTTCHDAVRGSGSVPPNLLSEYLSRTNICKMVLRQEE